MNFKISFLFIFSFLSLTIQAQKNITFEHITSEQGLSQNDVNGIRQDQNGFLWIATHDGLNKFDGYSFKNFLPNNDDSNSILNGLVQKVFSNDEYIWTISTGIGISRLNTKTETFLNFKYNKNNKSGLVTNHINYIFVDSDKQLWVGTQHGINVLDTKKLPENKDFQHFLIDENDFYSSRNDVRFVHEDSNHQIWVGTSSGLYKAFKEKRGNIITMPVSSKESNIPANSYITQIIENKLGDLIVSTRVGAFIKKKNSNKFQYFIEEASAEFCIDQNNNLWGGNSNGLHLYEYNNNTGYYDFKNSYHSDIKNPSSLNRNGVRNVFIDQSNIIWIGTKGGGINKMNPEGNPFKTIKSNLHKNSLSYNNIRSIHRDSYDKLWVGTEDGALNISKDEKFNSFKAYPFDDVFSLKEINHLGEKYMLIGSESNFLTKVKISKTRNYNLIYLNKKT